jgi:transcriptional regulator with XRE-family HTH domain
MASAPARTTIDRLTVTILLAARTTMGKLGNYLRAHRRRWHLTQDELAFLIGYDAASIISRLERDERTITLAVASASYTIFGIEPRELFPAMLESVEKGVIQRMHQLRERLMQRKPTQKTVAKLELLRVALNRMTAIAEEH